MSGFENDVMVAKNVNFDYTAVPPHLGIVTANGDLLIGSIGTTPNVEITKGVLTSPLGTLTIGYSYPNITLDLAGGTTGIDSIGVDTTTGAGTNPVVPTVGGLVTFTGGQYPTGTFGTRVITINSPAANTVAVNVQIATTSATSLITNNGVSHYDSADFTVDANGFVSIKQGAFAYTNVTTNPYTVLATDQFLSVSTSGGAKTLNFPNAPTTLYQTWTVKDRTGNASVNNITLTTPGGAVLIDGATTYVIAGNYGSIQILWNGSSYEIY